MDRREGRRHRIDSADVNDYCGTPVGGHLPPRTFVPGSQRSKLCRPCARNRHAIGASEARVGRYDSHCREKAGQYSNHLPQVLYPSGSPGRLR